MSIKKSLRIVLIVSSMLPVLIISMIAHGLITNRFVTMQNNNLQNLAVSNSNIISTLIETQQNEVSLLASQQELQMFIKSKGTADLFSSGTIDDRLHNWKSSFNHSEMLTLYNTDKKVIACTDSTMIDTDASNNATLSYLFTTKQTSVGVNGIQRNLKYGKPIYTLEIGSPILDVEEGNGTLLGYIINTVNLDYFNNYLKSVTLGDTGHCIAIDQEGTIMFHPDRSLIGSKIDSKEIQTTIKDYLLGQAPHSGSFLTSYNNNEAINGYQIIPELGWMLLVKQDVSELWSVTSIILTLLIFICAILLILIVIFAHSLTKRITAPILTLRDAMRTASDGDLTVQTNIRSKNELGELSKSFNKMLHIIKTNYEDLASMHEELLSNEEQLRTNYDHIEYLAYHDTLTNLPNKLSFLDYMNATLLSSYSKKLSHSVYFVDLDNFKTVNDTLGHEYGDTLLVKTAQILTTLMDGNGMLARAGGDEFLMFREGIQSKEEAVSFANAIIERFRHPLDLDGEEVYVSMSIGIALYPQNGISPNALIKNADIAMYKSKDTGRNKFTLFNAKMEEELNRNTVIIDILRNAIERKEIYIQYQPLFELATSNVIGFEALMRIRSERLGTINPDEFIPIAEESGLIIELSSWLLKEACSFNKRLIDQGITPRPVSINISSIQINRPGFIDLLTKTLKETGLPPEFLDLEITESTLVASITDATTLLTSLLNIGVRISLDDFGTGYSSLNYLTKMPINTLKIDKSFIDYICTREKDASIAKSIIQLAHRLNINVVAEGVENADQLAVLKEMKCDIIQGFIFSGPLHPPELVDLIEKR